MRFYVSPESIFPDKKIIEIIDRAEVHHIRDVMRLGKGLDVTVFDGKGSEYSGRIKELTKGRVVIDISSKEDLGTERSFNVTLYQAIPKKNKIDLIIEKAVELGVDRIVPVITERTIPDIKGRVKKKRERWMRIARAASKQSGRVRLPEVGEVMDFTSALSDSEKSGLVIFACLHKASRPLKDILKGSKARNISVFVGPEGDFSQTEISMADLPGYRLCSLGRLVLKVETAAIYILSCLNYEYSN